MFARFLAPAAIIVTGWILVPQDTPAKPDYTRRTKKECEYCHPPNSRLLNDAGKYYAEHRNSLEGYKPKEEAPKDQAKDAKQAPKK